MPPVSRFVQWNSNRWTANFKSHLRTKLDVIGELLVAHVVKTISIPTRTHGPSAPGEPPHSDTGRLKQSIAYVVDSDNLSVAVGTTLEYGYYLEYGTSRMAARPYLRPAMFFAMPSIMRAIKR